MSVFPNNGVQAGLTTNAVNVDSSCGDTQELFYDTRRCVPRFNPAAANAVMAEILNLATCAGRPYVCGTVDNLCEAMEGIVRARVLAMLAAGELTSTDANNVFGTGADDLGYIGGPLADGFAFSVQNNLNIATAGNVDTGPVVLTFAPGDSPAFANGVTWNGIDTLTAVRAGWYSISTIFDGDSLEAVPVNISNVFGFRSVNGGPFEEVWRKGQHGAGGGGLPISVGYSQAFTYSVLLQAGDTVRTAVDYAYTGNPASQAHQVRPILYNAVLVQDLGA